MSAYDDYMALVKDAALRDDFTQHPHQAEAVKRLEENHGQLLIAHGMGTGKCLGLGTPVLMSDGSIKPVEAIVNGDSVMGPDSLPRLVQGVTRGNGPLYRITPVKGDAWVCNDAHIMTMRDGMTREIIDVPLETYLASPGSRKYRAMKLFRVGIDFPSTETPCEPYLMGLWLGDGATNGPYFYTKDSEIADYLTAIAPRYGVTAKRRDEKTCPAYELTGDNFMRNQNFLRNEFKRCVVDGMKRIPSDYLKNDLPARLGLLAGLVDTDGHLTCGCYEIVTTLDGLKEDILYLARSLGFAAYAKRRKTAIKSTGFKGECWKIMISGDLSIVPVLLPRKKAAPRQQKKDTTQTGFTAEPIGNGDYYGFTLDGDGRFLLGDFTVTHNTGTSIAGFESLMAHGKAKRALVVVPAALRDNYLDDGVKKFTTSTGARFGPKGEAGSIHIDDAKLPDAHYYAVSNEMFRKDPHGYINRTGADTIIWDEAHKGRDPQSQNYAAMMSVRPKVRNFMALTGTPVMNHPHDVQPLVDIVTNKQHGLGRTTGEFDKLFVGKRIKHHGPLGWAGIGPTSEETILKNKGPLGHELRKHISYVSTEDIAEKMPGKTIHDIDVPMSHHQKKLYDFAMKSVDPLTRYRIKNNLPVGTREAQHVFSMISQARQVSNGIHTLDSHHTALSSSHETPKARRLIEDVHAHLQADPKNKAIIYTNMVHGGVDQLHAGLTEKGHNPGLFIGSGHQKKTDRDEHVKDYLAGRRRIMIINQAGTEGLNLPGTTAHFTLDPHFNPEFQAQGEARGVRAGSPVPHVDIYRYKSTIKPPLPFMHRETGTDEWIYGIAQHKEKLNNQFKELMK